MVVSDAQLKELKKAVNIQLAKGESEKQIREGLEHLGYDKETINRAFSSEGESQKRPEAPEGGAGLLDKLATKTDRITPPERTEKDQLLSEIFRKEIKESSQKTEKKESRLRKIPETEYPSRPREEIFSEGPKHRKTTILLNIFGFIILCILLLGVFIYFQEKINIGEILNVDDFYSMVPRDSFLTVKVDLKGLISSTDVSQAGVVELFGVYALTYPTVSVETLSEQLNEATGLDIERVSYVGLIMSDPKRFAVVIVGNFDPDDRTIILDKLKGSGHMFKYFGESQYSGMGIHNVRLFSIDLNLVFLKENTIIIGDRTTVEDMIDTLDGSLPNFRDNSQLKNIIKENEGAIVEFIIRKGSEVDEYFGELATYSGLGDGLMSADLLAYFYMLDINKNKILALWSNENFASAAETELQELVSEKKSEYKNLIQYLDSLLRGGSFTNGYKTYASTNFNKLSSLSITRDQNMITISLPFSFWEDIGSFIWQYFNIGSNGTILPGASGLYPMVPVLWECKEGGAIDLLLENRGENVIRNLIVNGKSCSTSTLALGERTLCTLKNTACLDGPIFYEENVIVEFTSSDGSSMTKSGWLWGSTTIFEE